MSPYKIVHPKVPHRSYIPGDMHIGKTIRIRGYIPSDVDLSSNIQVSLYESNKTVPLHIGIHFKQGIVVRNSREFWKLGTEEKDGPFPFRLGQEFLMEIIVQSDSYEISVDERRCWTFSHRLSYLKVSKLQIAGPVSIGYIEYSHRKNRPESCPPSPTDLMPIFNPPVPFCHPITGGIKPGMVFLILGKPLAKFHRFTISFQCGSTLIPPPDSAFFFDACSFNGTVVRNTRRHDTWEDEETAAPYFPFKPDTRFNMTIRIRNDKFVVQVNDQNFIEYYHRMSRFSMINTLRIDNDISIISMDFREAESQETGKNINRASI